MQYGLCIPNQGMYLRIACKTQWSMHAKQVGQVEVVDQANHAARERQQLRPGDSSIREDPG